MLRSSIRLFVRITFPSFYERVRRKMAFFRLQTGYSYDIKRYFNYSDYYFNDNEQRCMMRIIHRYHPIEKGLTMPEIRLGFGKDNIMHLINDCMMYREKYLGSLTLSNSASLQHYSHALSVLSEYVELHEQRNYSLDVDLIKKIYSLVTESVVERSSQIVTTKDKYFEHVESPFPLFALSRYSLRNFGGVVDINDILSAIRIAQKSPSACNRQPSRVHIVTDAELLNQILKIQDGNRGFGHLVDKLLVVSAELSGYRDISERNNVFVDGGMFAMSLLYSLHSLKIGTCPLNWCVTVEKDVALRRIINLPESESVVLLIACGAVPSTFKLASSKRSAVETIYSIV